MSEGDSAPQSPALSIKMDHESGGCLPLLFPLHLFCVLNVLLLKPVLVVFCFSFPPYHTSRLWFCFSSLNSRQLISHLKRRTPFCRDWLPLRLHNLLVNQPRTRGCAFTSPLMFHVKTRRSSESNAGFVVSLKQAKSRYRPGGCGFESGPSCLVSLVCTATSH